MDIALQDWLSLGFRWLHLITGIAWIGASFYFNWLENNLERLKNLRAEIAGNLWAVHGGGFYYVEKYKHTPSKQPEILHWFKWEAYFTWLSGMALLVTVYYVDASSMLLQSGKWLTSPALAVALSFFSLLFGWMFYHQLCKWFLDRSSDGWIFRGVGLGFFLLASYGLLQTFSDRAAYLHVGMIIGTIMVANVFFVIIPSQKALVHSFASGQLLDPNVGTRALWRSRHNNYLTLPVLFVMISNHYPMTFAHPYKWLILVWLCLLGVFIRHYFNTRHLRERKYVYQSLVPTVLLLLALVLTVASSSDRSPEQTPKEKISFTRVSAIFADRCLSCHSESPSDDVFTFAPQGVTFDSPGQIKSWLDKIKVRAVDSDNMPLANKTQMTSEERKILGQWIEAGAPVER